VTYKLLIPNQAEDRVVPKTETNRGSVAGEGRRLTSQATHRSRDARSEIWFFVALLAKTSSGESKDRNSQERRRGLQFRKLRESRRGKKDSQTRTQFFLARH